MKPASGWRRWIPIFVMIAWIYAASSLLQNAAPNTVTYTLLGGVIGITGVLVGLSIATGQFFPFAVGLIFLGTLLSSIPLFHAGSFTFPPDHWKVAVALAGSGALLLSPWIGRTVRRLSMLHAFNSLDGRAEPKSGPASREDVQILIRLDSGLDLMPNQRCTVTIRRPRESVRTDEVVKSDSESGGWRSAEHDHKMPFWVR